MDSSKKQKLDVLIGLIQSVFSQEKSLELLKMLAKCMNAISDAEIAKIRALLRELKRQGKSKVSAGKLEAAYNEVYDTLDVAIVHTAHLAMGKKEEIAQLGRELKNANREIERLIPVRDKLSSAAEPLRKERQKSEAELSETFSRISAAKGMLNKLFPEREPLHAKLRQAQSAREAEEIRDTMMNVTRQIQTTEAKRRELMSNLDETRKKIAAVDSSNDFKNLLGIEAEIKGLEARRRQLREAVYRARN